MAIKHDLKSFRLVIEEGQTSNSIEWLPSNTIPTTLVALHVFPINAVLGDVVKVEVIHPIAGVIAEYAKDTYLTTEVVHLSFDRSDALDILAGLTIRFTYTAINDTGRDFIMWVRFKQVTND